MRTLIRRKWLLLWATGFLIPVLWSLGLLLGRPPVVRPSVETTFLTGETLPDGSLDFSARRSSRSGKRSDSVTTRFVNRALQLPPKPTKLMTDRVVR